MYTEINFKTKKALKEAVTRGERIKVFQPGLFRGNEPKNGKVCVEGPHYPEHYRWYAECELRDGVVVSVR